MTFKLTKREQSIIKVWKESHKCDLRNNKDYAHGKTTISFTPMRLGMAITVTCKCGKSLVVRDALFS